MADNTKALKWAAENPADPRAQKIQAKVWAESNPGDPRAAAIMSKLGGQEAASPASPSVSKEAASSPTKTFGEQAINTATLGYLPQVQTGLTRGAMKLDDYIRGTNNSELIPYTATRDSFIKDMQQGEKENPLASTAGKFTGAVGSAFVPGGAFSNAAKGASALGRVGRLGVQAGTTGFVANPGDKEGEAGELQLLERAKNAGISTIAGLGLGAFGEGVQSQGSKLADWLMLKAVGQTKHLKGVGNTLVDEGIRGSEDTMKRQVADKIAQRGKELDAAVESIPGHVDNRVIADKISKKAKGYINNDGSVSKAAQGKVDDVVERVDDIASRKLQSYPDALQSKRVSAREGYRDGEPRAAWKSELAQAETSAYGDAIERGYAAKNPDKANIVSDSNRKLSALYGGQRGLDKDPTLRKGLPLTTAMAIQAGTSLGSAGLGGAMGYGSGGWEGAGKGALGGLGLALAARNPYVQSNAAHLATKAGGAAEKLVDPKTMQALFALMNGKEGE